MWIRLKNIQVYGYHGAHAHEREHGGRFEIDVELRADLEQAAKSDDLADTVDYVKLQRTVEELSSTKHRLIESLADVIARRLLSDFPAEEVIVRVRKPGAAIGGVLDSVEVECHRLKKDEG
ncbi:MAG: dihydroneopterin aldolase [Bacteroidota bacterium]|nr:dihydroneopterin aldolase [Bacteroidota bacterium]MDP4233135.1 dihydroneopterin aldolase [Bacteroidota bacterium]MDP4241720.1 dihydroneopterin aldolase [Bacteroidota bacterium]MDP4287378.1 dihydroneopterin aldolase [Bacteroidota bacterium]